MATPAAFSIPNYSTINIKELTYLKADIEPNATTFTLQNNENIVANDYVAVGNRGETREIRLVQSASGATIVTTDSLKLHHDQNEWVEALRGNKICIYRSVSTDPSNATIPADSSFQLLNTIDIRAGNLQTDYVDVTSSGYDWYKFTYKNSTTNVETSLTYSTPMRAGSVTNYVSLDDIKTEAGLGTNFNLPDGLVEGFRQAAQTLINGSFSGQYLVPFKAPINPLIAQITKSYAAAYLRFDQFGNDDTNGMNKIKWADDVITRIQSGKLVLTGSGGSPETGGSSDVDLGFSGFPNGTTKQPDGGNGFMFERTDIDGYYGRKY